MANNYDELIDAFEKKMRKLMSEYQSLKEQNALLISELERRRNDLMGAHQEILELRKNYDHLQMAKGFGLDESEKNEARHKIAKMVREIDKCIALLDE